MPVQKRQRNQRGEGSRLREELIEAAMRILDRSPATVLSLRMVAKEAGVAAPSVYAHFTDAQHLTTEIVRECWRQLGEEMAAALTCALSASAQTDARVALKVQLCAYVRYAMERPSRYQLLFAMQPIDTNETHALPALVQPAFRKVRDCLDDIRGQGGTMPGADTFGAALMILSLVHGRIALAQLAPWRQGNDTAGLQEFVGDALDRLLPPAL